MTTSYKVVFDKFNHRPEPEFQGIWYPYNGSRLKDCYDLKLTDGRIVHGYYPNACAWYPRHNDDTAGRECYYDDQVAEIRLMTDEEIETRCQFGFTGQDRLERNLSYFGDVLPTIVRDEHGVATLMPKIKRMFDDSFIVSSWTGTWEPWFHENELTMEELDTAINSGDTTVNGFFISLDKYITRSKAFESFVLSDSLPIEELRSLYQQATDALNKSVTEPKKVKSAHDENTVKLTGKQYRKLQKKLRRIARENKTQVVE